MVTLPGLIPFTTPLELTVAILVLEEDQVMVLGDVLVGVKVFMLRVVVLPFFIEAVFLFRLILLAATLPTVRVNFLVCFPIVTLIVVLPGLRAVITPVLSTLATLGLDDLYLGVMPVALAGFSLVFMLRVLPTCSELFLEGVMVKLFRARAFVTTCTLQVVFLLPSLLVMVMVAFPSFTPFSLPCLSTVTTLVFELLKLRPLSLAL